MKFSEKFKNEKQTFCFLHQLLRRRLALSLQFPEVWDPWQWQCFWRTPFWRLKKSFTRSHERLQQTEVRKSCCLFNKRKNTFIFYYKAICFYIVFIFSWMESLWMRWFTQLYAFPADTFWVLRKKNQFQWKLW